MNILLVGYYGFGNFGDEWLCRQCRQFINDHVSDCTFKIAVRTPSQANHVNRLSIFEMMSAIRWSDTVVFGGGGIFQTDTSYRSVGYYMSIMIAAKILRRPYWLMGQSVGVISNRFTRQLLEKLLSRASLFSVRDLSEINHSQIMTADLCYYGSSFNDTGRKDAPLAVCLRQAWMNSDIDTVIQSLPLSLSLICQQDQDIQLSDSVILPHCTGPLSVVISMRYHACVWASLQGIPFIAMGDDPKLKSIAVACDQIWLPLASGQQLVTTLQTMQLNWTMYHANLVECVPKMSASFTPLHHALQRALQCELNT
jgi:polysaccharide pyruvyl transferase WcaK-like protein